MCKYDVIHKTGGRSYITYHSDQSHGHRHYAQKVGKFGHVVIEICERTAGQTDRQSDTVIIILHTPHRAK